MTDQTVQNLIDTMGNARRENRDRVAHFIIKQPRYFEDLLELSLQIKYKYHYKAAWVLELVLEKNLHFLYPYFDYFSEHIGFIKNDSAARPLSKICKWMVNNYIKNTDPILTHYIHNKQIAAIVQTNFDWLIGNFKVATKVFALDSLYDLGSLDLPETQWINEQLQAVLAEQISYRSSGFQNHGKKILNLLRKKS